MKSLLNKLNRLTWQMSQRGGGWAEEEEEREEGCRREKRRCLLASLLARCTLQSHVSQSAASSAQQKTEAASVPHPSHCTFISTASSFFFFFFSFFWLISLFFGFGQRLERRWMGTRGKTKEWCIYSGVERGFSALICGVWFFLNSQLQLSSNAE